MKLKTTLTVISALAIFAGSVLAQGNQYGNPANKKIAVHSGNLVKTVFSNAGVIGQPSNGGPRGAWIYDNNGYIGDISLMVGVEKKMGSEVDYTNTTIKNLITANKDSIYHSVIISDVARPAKAQEQDPSGNPWTFQPKGGYANASQKYIAMSTDPKTWPSTWPDKSSDWNGFWNGYFGKTPKSDQESYFVMDDNIDQEFNLPPFNLVPDPADLTRKGMGLNVKVRGLQWSQFLAQDCIFWLYEIENSSVVDYNKAVFGLICGTYIGVTGTDDSPQEYNDDASFFDVENNLVYSWDFPQNNNRNPNWVGKKVGYVGYAFLESPGNQFDGIDNDRDSKITATKFTPDDFDTNKAVVQIGSKLITIRRSTVMVGTKSRVVYIREAHDVTDATPFQLQTLGMKSPVTITPGVTKLMEGNVIKKFVAASGGVPAHFEDVINPNALDGIDNDFDGLIDENYYVHYRQYKIDQNGVVLFDKIVPAAYINYKGGVGLNGSVADPMIDEGRDDGIDNDGDWDPATDDVGGDGIANSGDLSDGENDGVPSPGEPNFDATDVDESDQIGLTSFNYFAPSNEIDLKSDESLWTNLSPGLFSTPSNIADGKALFGDDGDFTFGSGFFPLLSKNTERFSFALLYGEDLKDFYKNRRVVQNIYDNNYRFPQPPEKPVLKAVAGDNMVTLYWGRISEESVDPVLKDENGKPVKDFEGYKVYRSRDNNFEDVRLITDADGRKVGYQPIAQYDIPGNKVLGYFETTSDIFQTSSGYTFYLGDDQIGLVHKYVDTEVKNGITYFYAVTAYDRGVDTLGIFPSENTLSIRQESSGEYITDVNTAVVVPVAPTSGYRFESTFPLSRKSGFTNSGIAVNVVDDSRLLDGKTYQVTFNDQATDGADNNSNGKVDSDDYYELIPSTIGYSVKNTTGIVETFTADGSGNYELANKPAYLDSADVVVKTASGTVLSPAVYKVDSKNGKITRRKGVDNPFTDGAIFSVEFKPFNVYKSPYLPNNPGLPETANRSGSDDITFDGVTMKLDNFWSVQKIDSTVVVVGDTTSLKLSIAAFEFRDNSSKLAISYTAFPYDYEIETSNTIIGKSRGDDLFGLDSLPVKFRIKNLTTGKYVKFLYNSNSGSTSGEIGTLDNIVILEEAKKDYNGKENRVVNGVSIPFDVYHNTLDGKYVYGYQLEFAQKDNKDLTINRPLKFVFKTTKPFSSSDVFEFTTKVGTIESAPTAKADMMNIRVVPNPYVAANSMERPLPPNITSGRGERRIEFRNVPNDATIYIFTSAGDLIRTLYADGALLNGTVKWDLKTKENLDVAAGVYFYVLESKYGKKEGKIGIIK